MPQTLYITFAVHFVQRTFNNLNIFICDFSTRCFFICDFCTARRYAGLGFYMWLLYNKEVCRTWFLYVTSVQQGGMQDLVFICDFCTTRRYAGLGFYMWLLYNKEVCRTWFLYVTSVQQGGMQDTVFALLCFVVVIHWLIFPYPSGLLHWHCGNLTIAPVPAKQPWWIWINTSCEFIMNDCITTTKQSTTKPCAYFLGYTVIQWQSSVLGVITYPCHRFTVCT